MAELFLIKDERFALKEERAAVPVGYPPDWRERERALDIRASWIVEAPAGSGKTGLLVQRFLKLLADESVTEPDQVLAITFMVKATAELRERVVGQLEGAVRETATDNPFAEETRALAEAVLRRDAMLGWGLLERPERLAIRTIDSVCAEIARSLPVLSGSGGRFVPVADASLLYRQAARRTLQQLGGADATLTAALRTVLLHRDGDLTECERLLAEMLAWRDQWGQLVPLVGPAQTDAELDATVLPKLERALDQAICAGLTQLAKTIPPDVLQALVFLASEMGSLGGYNGAPSPVALCAGLKTNPGETAEHLDHWRALIHLLTTKDTTWRKAIAKNSLGFEIGKKQGVQLKALVASLSDTEDLLIPMKRVRCLPPATYPPEQWVVAKALFRVLHQALVELQLVFAERGECDFAELGLLARTALGRDEHGDDLAAAMGMRLQHLLVDEMQDTSTSQYALIELMTHGWDGQSQTVFLVGDPKQSIFLFRQARVERFVRTMRTGKLGELAVGCLRLTANFRSQANLVREVNADFARVFPSQTRSLHPEDVPFVAATAVRERTEVEGRAWHTGVVREMETRQRKSRESAREVRRIIDAWRARPLPSGRTKPWSIAVLVRSRGHLGEIVTALQQPGEDGPVPFRAVDIELLAERQEVLDLFALTRALLHPADRVAWLAILRAPWCGLTLADLHLLAGADDPAWAEVTVEELIERRGELLSSGGCQRLERIWTVMQAAARQRGRLTLAQWVERSWRALGGGVWLGEAEQRNADRYFALLDEMAAAGEGFSLEQLDARLKKLYAEPSVVAGAVDLMTIHAAKGLEWDVVIVPALERVGQTSRGRLLTWLELDSADAEAAHIVLAPIVGRGEGSRELNEWMRSIHAAREAAERKRLLYVACTRAREELHLFATPAETSKGEVNPPSESLLHAAWPAVEGLFGVQSSKPKTLQFARPSLVDKTGLALAASAEKEEEAAPEPPPQLRRLPSGYAFASGMSAPVLSIREDDGEGRMGKFARPEGSFAARAFGNAVHAFLEISARRVAGGEELDHLLAELPQWLPRVTVTLRSSGLSPAMVERLAQRVLAAVANTLEDETGRWVLAAHPGAATEHALTAWDERRSSVRLDRIFRAGRKPGEPGADCLWVVDYKATTHGREGLGAFLAAERERYAPQMAAYAEVLGEAEVRMMLYYPLIPATTWWVVGSSQET